MAVAGTPTSIVMCEKALNVYDRKAIHNTPLTYAQIAFWLEKFNISIDKRKEIQGLEEKRADIIFAGTLILQEAMKHFSAQNIRVSVGGLRYGALDL